MNEHRSPDFATRARRLYRQAAADVGPHMAARLRAARRSALEGKAAPSPLRRPFWLMPAGALAVTVLAVALAWQPLQNRHHPAPTPATAAASTASDLPPDPDDTDPAMYQNLDFYAWLASQHTHAHTR